MAKKLSRKSAENSSANDKSLTFSQRILKIREHFSLSQGELADMTGGSPSAIGLIERGKTAAPNADVLVALARKLAINSEWLLLGEGEMLKNSAPPIISEEPQIISSYEPGESSFAQGTTPGTTVTQGRLTMREINLPPTTKAKSQPEPAGMDLVRQVAQNTRKLKELAAVVEQLQEQAAQSSAK